MASENMTTTTSAEKWFHFERSCECGYIPFEAVEDFRTDLMCLKGEIPSTDMNSHGQCECGFTPSLHRNEEKNGKYTNFSLYWKIDSHDMNAHLAKNCNIKAALRNHNTFPAINTLVKWKQQATLKSRHHWCTLIGIDTIGRN